MATEEENRELLAKMFDLVETCFVRLYAQHAALEVLSIEEDWQSHVERLVSTYSAGMHERLRPLRDTFLASPSGTIQQTDWHRIVQRLIESAEEIDPEA